MQTAVDILKESALANWHFDNLPGNNPQNWPIGLDKLNERLLTLPELGLFNEPFDLSKNFKSKSKAYVEQTLNTLKKEKNVTADHAEVKNLLAALNAILQISLHSGSFTEIVRKCRGIIIFNNIKFEY